MRLFYFLLIACSANAQDTTDYAMAKSMNYMVLTSSVDCTKELSSTLEARICSNLQFQKSDSILRARLDSLYQKLDSIHNKNDGNDSLRKGLNEFQKTWIEHRRLQSQIYMGGYSGNVGGTRFYKCMNIITENRINELDLLFNN